MEEKRQIKLAIVDDHNIMRKGLIKLINRANKEKKYQVVFEAANGAEMKEQLRGKELPDIILMDIQFDKVDAGYDLVAWLKDNFPHISILVLSTYEAEEPIVKMLRLGVKGYLSKNIEVDDMHMALEAIGNNRPYFPDFVTEVMVQAIQGSSPEGTLKNLAGSNNREPGDLTEKEMEFLNLACSDLTYHQIAEKMYLSPKTIDKYRESLFTRFEVESRVGLALYAVKHGLVKI